jgi:hypothetical protein
MRAIPNLPWTALLPTLKVAGKAVNSSPAPSQLQRRRLGAVAGCAPGPAHGGASDRSGGLTGKLADQTDTRRLFPHREPTGIPKLWVSAVIGPCRARRARQPAGSNRLSGRRPRLQLVDRGGRAAAVPTKRLQRHRSGDRAAIGPYQPCPQRALTDGHGRSRTVSHGSLDIGPDLAVWSPSRIGPRPRQCLPSSRRHPLTTAASAGRAVRPARRHSGRAKHAAGSVQPPGGR